MRRSLTLSICAVMLTLLPGAATPRGGEAADTGAATSLTGERSQVQGALDGMTFEGGLGPLGKPLDIQDRLIFAGGTFRSMECERRCNYPASPYYTRQGREGVEFVSESRCPDTGATILWRGTVKEGTIAGEFTWTMARWYWTIEKQFWFEGRLAAEAEPVASNP